MTVAFSRLCGGMHSRSRRGLICVWMSLSGHRLILLKHIDYMLASAEWDCLGGDMENCWQEDVCGAACVHSVYVHTAGWQIKRKTWITEDDSAPMHRAWGVTGWFLIEYENDTNQMWCFFTVTRSQPTYGRFWSAVIDSISTTIIITPAKGTSLECWICSQHLTKPLRVGFHPSVCACAKHLSTCKCHEELSEKKR